MRCHVRYRLSYADVAELLAERGVRVDPSTVYAWVRELAPLYEGAARPFRHDVGSAWSVGESYITVAGKPAYVYWAMDGQGQVVDVCVSARRTTADAAAFFRHAIAAIYPPALVAAISPVAHEMGKRVQQRIERDHQHRKGRLHPMRGFKACAGARLFCRAHAFLRNLRGQFYDLGRLAHNEVISPYPPLVRAWDALTGILLGR